MTSKLEHRPSIMSLPGDREKARKRHWGIVMGNDEPVIQKFGSYSSNYSYRTPTPTRVAPVTALKEIPGDVDKLQNRFHVSNRIVSSGLRRLNAMQDADPVISQAIIFEPRRDSGWKSVSESKYSIPGSKSGYALFECPGGERKGVGDQGSFAQEQKSKHTVVSQIQAQMVASKGGRFQCSTCSALFRRKYDLKTHTSAVHEKRRPHVCPYADVCNASFAHRGTMTKHISTVSNLRFTSCETIKRLGGRGRSISGNANLFFYCPRFFGFYHFYLEGSLEKEKICVQLQRLPCNVQ